MSVYTRFGDKGKTSLYAGKTVSKASLRVNTYGTLDELNSFLGVVISRLENKEIKKESIAIQNDLFGIGAFLANPTSKDLKLGDYLKKRVKEFEKTIDKLTEKLPELENFILPGGGVSGAGLHFARTLARRTERRVVELSEKENIDKDVLIYLNRLSDLLFTFARFINYKEKKKEIIWKKR
jgi:cob(I)alamin adenosyltransferase